jgi:hypothetical protein
MKLSRSHFQDKEKTTVKRILLVAAAALMLLNTLVVPTVVHADGTPYTNCGGNSICKP